jgi:hypothetical protein
MDSMQVADQVEERLARLERDLKRSRRLAGVALVVAALALGVAGLQARSTEAQSQSLRVDSLFARSVHVGGLAGGVDITATSNSAEIDLSSGAAPQAQGVASVSIKADSQQALVWVFDPSHNAASIGYGPYAPGAFRAIEQPPVAGQDNVVWSAP